MIAMVFVDSSNVQRRIEEYSVGTVREPMQMICDLAALSWTAR